MSDERRSNRRKLLLLEARWESMSRKHEARVDDVSLGGCFVNTVTRVAIDQAVDLEIRLPSGDWLPLRGHVATYQPGVGFGMSFSSLTNDETVALTKLLYFLEERSV